MRRTSWLIVVALLAGVGRLAADEAAETAVPQPAVDYLGEIKPILEARCYACHGPLKQEQGLRLDTAAAMRQGGDSGAAIEAHAPGESLLLAAVTGSDGWRMPPEGEPLSAEQIDRIARWIDAGAPGPADEEPAADPATHWAFQLPQSESLPEVRDADWASHPIDRWLAAEHDRLSLAPVALADKATLLRRVYIDLIGLPPTADELASFLANESPEAYSNVVERLLASPQYGQRWARHWMDIWRYSDWYGYGAEVRNSQPHIWRWRDWIVDSLNGDRGYDQMIIAMLAGDEAAPGDSQSLAATGYLARNWYKFNRNTWLQDTVEHTSKAMLGLTFNCARCHDHKYDPISQQDYYQLRAYFEPHDVRTDAVDGQRDRSKDGLPRVYDAHLDRPTHLFVRGDEKQPDTDNVLLPGLPALLPGESPPIEPIELPATSWYPSADPAIRQSVLDEALARLAQAQAALEKLAAPESTVETDAPPPASEADKQLAEKNVALALAQLLAVQAKIAADNARLAASGQANALALAAGYAQRQAELVAAEHTAQAAQQQLSGAQAAENAEDEKTKQAVVDAQKKVDETHAALEAARTAAAQPTADYATFEPAYPATSSGRRLALARWIASPQNPLTARVAVNHVWRRMFGQALVSTMFDFGLNGRAPSHPQLLDWLAVDFMQHDWSLKHLHRQIVTSRAYQLRSAGDERNGQFDPDNRFVWRMNVRRMDAEVVRDAVLHLSAALDSTLGGPELDQATADTTTRRSLYYRHANEKRVTFLELFDQPGVSEAYERVESIVPQQALALLNSAFAIERSRALAEQLWSRAESAGDKEQASARFVDAAFLQILGRPARSEELQASLAYFETTAESTDDAGADSDAPAAQRASFVHVLFNHNDFVSLR